MPDLHIQAYFAGARAAAGQPAAAFPRPLTPSELECWRDGFLEHRAEHLALVAEPFVQVHGQPLPILIPPCQGEGADDVTSLVSAALLPPKEPAVSVSCPCPTPVPGQPVIRSPECLQHPSGNRWLARAIVLGARSVRPCHEAADPPAGCMCVGCYLFRAEARAALEIAGCIEREGAALLPDDLRGSARLEDPTQPSTTTAAGLDPYGSPALAAKAFAQRQTLPEHVPAGLYGGSVSDVTERPRSGRSRNPRPSSATQAPAPTITPPEGSAVPVPAAVPPPADEVSRRRRGRAADEQARRVAERRRRPTAAELRTAR